MDVQAMALAVLLGRTLVLPQLTCFCWNNWYAADRCRMPGDYWSQLPWGCSLEQVCMAAGVVRMLGV